MVVCKYYLQGNCRFGDNCRFEHQINDFNAVSTSILRQSQPQQSPPQNFDISVAIRAVANDMLLAEKGGQWLLSCYAPFKGKPPFPGFEDMSFEEVRYGFYSAQQNGTIEQYKQQLQSMLHEIALRIRALQNPSPDIVNIIKTLFNAPVKQESSTVNSSFSFAEAGKSIFAQKPQQSTNIFAQASQVMFGQNQPQQQNFGDNSGSIFNRSQQSSNVFATATPQQPSNVFATAQQPSNIFATTTPQQASNVFATIPQQASNVFATTPQQISNVFATTTPQQASNVFAPQQQQQPVFASQWAGQNTSQFSFQQQAPPQSSQNIFGGSATNSMQTFLNLGGKQDDLAYSKREDLSESEVRAFEADLFEFGQIPEKPPTVQMCL